MLLQKRRSDSPSGSTVVNQLRLHWGRTGGDQRPTPPAKKNFSTHKHVGLASARTPILSVILECVSGLPTRIADVSEAPPGAVSSAGLASRPHRSCSCDAPPHTSRSHTQETRSQTHVDFASRFDARNFRNRFWSYEIGKN